MFLAQVRLIPVLSAVLNVFTMTLERVDLADDGDLSGGVHR